MFTGVVKDKVERVLQTRAYYENFLSKTLSRREYQTALRNDEQNLLANHKLTLDEVRFALRYPRSEEALVDACLLRLYDKGLIATWRYDKAAFHRFDLEMREKFDHGDHCTFIYPEEARLVFALSSILEPSVAVTLGSFYGWWAFWTLPAIQKTGGKMWLVDSNLSVCDLASRNLERLGFQNCALVVNGDAVQFLTEQSFKFDFVLLDAEGSDDDPRTDHRGKAIYGPIFEALSDCLKHSSKLVCHNVLSDAPTLDDEYLADRAANYSAAYSGFYAAVEKVFQLHLDLETTEGIAVYGNNTDRADQCLRANPISLETY